MPSRRGLTVPVRLFGPKVAGGYGGAIAAQMSVVVVKTTTFHHHSAEVRIPESICDHMPRREALRAQCVA